MSDQTFILHTGILQRTTLMDALTGDNLSILSILDKNLVSFSPLTPDINTLDCEISGAYWQNLAYPTNYFQMYWTKLQQILFSNL